MRARLTWLWLVWIRQEAREAHAFWQAMLVEMARDPIIARSWAFSAALTLGRWCAEVAGLKQAFDAPQLPYVALGEPERDSET